jgi:adenylate cyclase
MLEERSGDLVWRMGAERKDERRLILVDINEQSLREIGPWPWPRATQARLIEQLAKAGARQQILDIVLADARPDDAKLNRSCSSIRPCWRRSSPWIRHGPFIRQTRRCA